VSSGFREVVLTGIHLGQYGSDLKGKGGISSLVSEILDKTDICRLRLSSIEVNEIDDGLLELFANQRLMPHLHIPLQSGDDGVLRLMNRQYDAVSFRDKVLQVHEVLPGAALGTDIIAGFPQESEEAFNNTLRLAESLPFTYMHVFPYSRRPGTPAADMVDLVGPAERKRRAAVLRELAAMKKLAYMNRQSGRTLDVLIEEKVDERLYHGTSCNYLKVYVTSDPDIRGIVVPACITGTGGGGLMGVPVSGREPREITRKSVCTNSVQ
jgi:threonylcarbamoyladenosine tRNA methylthiotransferase MtaB